MTAKLEIKAALRGTKTFLKNCFFTTPFKIADITENKGERCLQLMLMTSSPGILDGDQYDIKIELREGCLVELHTQSYQRLFHMKEGASQTMEVLMAKNASFYFLPHPCVPHKSSIFKARNRIFLSEGCTIIWGEILTCGRKSNGESFAFSRYHNLTEIFLGQRLVIKENLLITPSQTDLSAIGQYEGFTHQANLIYLDEKADTAKLTDQIKEYLSESEGILFGVSLLPFNGLIVRILGYKAEQLHQLLKRVAAFFTYSPETNPITERAKNHAN